MADELPSKVEVQTVKCLSICKGPVVVVRRGGTKYYFKKLRGKAARHALASFVCGDEMSGDLKAHLCKKK